MSEYSDYGSLQQPPSGYVSSAAPSDRYGPSQSASSAYGQGALAVADADDGGSGGGGTSSPAQLHHGLKLNLNLGKKTRDPLFGGGQHAAARWIAELLVLIARDRLVAKGLTPA